MNKPQDLATEIDLDIEIQVLEELVKAGPEKMAKFMYAHGSDLHPNWGYKDWYRFECNNHKIAIKSLEVIKKHRTDKSVRSPEKEEA